MVKLFNKDCTRCSLSSRPRNDGLAVCVPGEGPVPCDILFYGEAPGQHEEQENRPFVGEAGSELDGLFGQAGIDRRDIRISNIVRCRPPNNRTPSKDEVNACMFYTVHELQVVKPKIIIALGGSALKALTGKSKVGENRGKAIPLLPEYRNATKVLPTYHPAAYLHNPSAKEVYSKAIIEDMRMAARIANGGGSAPDVVTTFDTKKKLRRTLKLLSRCDLLTCDLEWEVLEGKRGEPDGMWPWSRRAGPAPRAVSVSLAGRVDGAVVACAVPFGAGYDKVLQAIIERVPTVYHNAMADLIWLYHLGWKPKLGGDTLLLASLLNLDTSLALKVLAAMLTDMPPGWGEGAPVGKMPSTKEEWLRLLIYNGKDAIATLLLLERLLRMFEERGRENVLPLYEHVLLPAVVILARSALAGTPIDQKMLAKVDAKAKNRIAEMVKEVGDALGVQGDAKTYEKVIGSGEQLGPYIERAAKVVLPRTPKKQTTSVTNDVLGQIKKRHHSISTLIDLRAMQKFKSGYTSPWRWLLTTQGDKRLHTVYRLAHTRSGRSSAQGEIGYTFQQFPRRAKIRRLIKARKGWKILSVDQSLLELRIAAWKANERRMIQFLQDGVDMHKATAGWIKALDRGMTLKQYLAELDDWLPTITYEERYGAKAYNFGLLFGGGPGVVVRTARKNYGIKFSPEKAETGYDAYFQLYPDLVPWHDSCVAFVEQGWVETGFHRIRNLNVENEDAEGKLRKAINDPVQADASDISLCCMNYTWELLYEKFGADIEQLAEPIGFFHDAHQIHFNADIEESLVAVVRQAWEHPPLGRVGVELPVPLVADIKVGRRWIS